MNPHDRSTDAYQKAVEYLADFANAHDPVEGGVGFGPKAWGRFRNALYTVLRSETEKQDSSARAEPVAWTTKLALECSRDWAAFEVSAHNLWGDRGIPLYAAALPAEKQQGEAMKLLDYAREALYNPFEPDNQSAIYKRINSFLYGNVENKR